jgi:hypothetical protein
MTEPSPSPRPSAWWETRSFAIAMIVMAIVPLLLPPIPPLTDLMGHMGRYRVQLEIDTSPFLSRYYSFDWSLIGNLACDLLVQILGPRARSMGACRQPRSSRCPWLTAIPSSSASSISRWRWG